MKADINVTPLIDVLLVLLIIFMLVTPSPPTALDASLPKPPDDATKPAAQDLLLEVEKENWRLNATPVLSAVDLESRLRTTFESRSDRTLFVRVADGVPYARVIAALDLARGCGASRIGMVDEQPAAR